MAPSDDRVGERADPERAADEGRDDACRRQPGGLLRADEPHPLALENANACGPFVIVCEHAGKRLPAALGTLGLDEKHLAKHFMWDIGALALARGVAARLGAPLLHQRYSRMVCDCNRRTDVPSYIPEAGEGVPVPGNRQLDAAAVTARTEAIWRPFHDGLAAFLDRRARPTALVTIHTFTPVFFGVPRPWEVGVLHDRDAHLSPATLAALRATHGDLVGDNEPYVMGRGTDYTVPVHGEDRGLPCVEIEVRNDLLATTGDVERWAGTLAEALTRAYASLPAAVRAA